MSGKLGARRVRPHEVVEMRRLHRAGLSLAEIGRRTGRGHTTIRRHTGLRRYRRYPAEFKEAVLASLPEYRSLRACALDHCVDPALLSYWLETSKRRSR